jgi:hypothetical protein
MAELLTVPFVINHAGANASEAWSSMSSNLSSNTQCRLCGNDLHKQSSTTSAVCLVCETQAFILFSFGLALSSPSQRSCRMKLHDVLVPEGHSCLVPEWSTKRHMVNDEPSPLCSCAFCKILITDGPMDCSYLDRDCQSLIIHLMQSTSDRLRQLTKTDYSWLRLFKRSQSSGQIHWNDQIKDIQQLEEQEENLMQLIKCFLPSVHTVRISLDKAVTD